MSKNNIVSFNAWERKGKFVGVIDLSQIENDGSATISKSFSSSLECQQWGYQMLSALDGAEIEANVPE